MAATLAYFRNFFSGGVDPGWPHGILLSITVLASFAVAAGILLERPKYSESVHRIATWLVLCGVAVEAFCTIVLFVFDEGISNAQQDKIIALEKRLLARSLSDEQISAIAERLKPFSGQEFDIVAYWKNPESLGLANRLFEALNKADWKYDKPQSGEFILGVQTGIDLNFDRRVSLEPTKALHLPGSFACKLGRQNFYAHGWSPPVFMTKL
jgi:hypothetical protein